MAHERRVIRLTGPVTSRVRYGRAVLTITRDGDLNSGALGKAITAYEQGKLGAMEVCQQFVRARVRKHTPSFTWERAHPERVLRLVMDASERPSFRSSDHAHVAEQLARAAQDEREEIKKAMEKMGDPFRVSKQLGTILGDGRLDALAGFERALGTTRLELASAHILAGHTPTLVDRVRVRLDDLNLGVEGGKLMADKFAQLGLASKAIDPQLFRTADWVRALPDPTSQWRRLHERLAPFLESFKQALPVNWQELEEDEVDRAVALMTSEGLSLAWAPRPEVIRALLAADGHSDRCSVLRRYREEIIEDVEGALAAVSRADLRPVAEAGFEAIRTYRDGHAAPAQTYAAAAIGEVIHGPLGWETFGEVRKAFKGKDPLQDVGYNDFPLFAVGRALVRVLDRFDEAGDGFNRNLTQHRIGSPHNEPNLLMVLMLLAGLVREVERVLNRHDAREAEKAA